MKLAPAVLENTHVRLEPFKEDHREPLRAASADPAIWTYVMTQVEGDKFDAFLKNYRERLMTPVAVSPKDGTENPATDAEKGAQPTGTGASPAAPVAAPAAIPPPPPPPRG